MSASFKASLALLNYQSGHDVFAFRYKYSLSKGRNYNAKKLIEKLVKISNFKYSFTFILLTDEIRKLF